MFWRTTRLVLALPAVLFASDRIALIEFFGYRDLDPDSVRHALQFQEGDKLFKGIEEQARSAVKRATGRDATDVALVCCIGDGDSVIYIGLPGSSSQVFTLNPAPQDRVIASRAVTALYRKMDQAEKLAVQNGISEEDGHQGYRLMKEPGARAAELAVHEYALRHENEIIRVLESSSKPDQRALAADALGYGRRSERQIAQLVRAARDADPGVRNNATRALLEILRGAPSAAAQVPPDTFIGMLQSGTWTDRNKASAVLWTLTQSRDPQLLARMKLETGDALWEMAGWRNNGSAYFARAILGRIAGIPEDRINLLALGPLDGFVSAIGR
jgi:hypothetical protein